MLNAETNLHPHPAMAAGLSRNTGAFPLPVLVWVETHKGEWDLLTIAGPREGLQAMNNGLGSVAHADWHFVVGRLAAAARDPTPDALEWARHALAVYAARICVLEG